MSTTEATAPSVAPGHSLAPVRSMLRRPGFGVAVAVLGSLLLVLAGLLPVWGTRLIAPQYPKGLDLWFFGDRVEGPVREVNNLNHYIGMQPIDLARVPEMALWPLAIAGSGVLLVMAVLSRGPLSRLALLGLWLGPLVILADIQRWLITFATELAPDAALRLGSFVPLVVGPTQVWNFTVLTYPGPALVLMWLVALLATLARRGSPPTARARWLTASGSLAIVLVGTLLLVVPASPAAAEGQASGARSMDAPPSSNVDLSALIASAPSGATVEVPEGTYRTHLVLDRPIELVADGHVLLDGGGRGTVVTITSDDVVLRGFHVAHTGGQVEEAAAIKVVGARGVTLEGNRVEDFFTGIAALGARDLRIRDNAVTGSAQVTAGADHAAALAPAAPPESAAGQPAVAHASHADGHTGHGPDGHAGHGTGAGPGGQGDGISLWDTEGVTLAGNTIERVRDALYLNYADGVLIDSNVIRASRYAVHSMFGSGITVFGNRMEGNLAGLVFMYSHDVLAGRNSIMDHRSSSTGFGVVLKDVVGVRVAENVIARNRIGLKAEATRHARDAEAVVLRNRFAANGAAVTLMASADLGFGANTFEGNVVDVRADDVGVARNNDWTFQGTGNHWSRYAGYDLDGDEVGDLPHVASGAMEAIVGAAPALELYRTSPALHALMSAQGLWEADRRPLVTDHAPRLDDHAPGFAAADLGGGADSADQVLGWVGLALALALLSSLGLALGRSRTAARPR
jgi:nitrous oxidase accessory protein